ncbi:MAG: hypothetical protein KDA57_05145 [Planctomycetales bacterium]|nr:hypothetical protein [Planctomycetales bacterium]
MRAIALIALALLGGLSALASSRGEESTKYLLRPALSPNEAAAVSVDLEVGGEMILRDEAEEKQLPMNVTGKLLFQEQLIAWSDSSDEASRSIRNYQTAKATIQVDKKSLDRSLPVKKRVVVAELREGRGAMASSDSNLTREEFDLLNVLGNSLVIDRLLPGREIAEGENWDHDKATIGALLGMDHVAVCEVSSVITGQAHQQVQIRLAGTVHGTIDGAATEIDLRGAYLFHQVRKRITKFNLAVKEKRAAGEVVPGLDVVAKVRLVVDKSTAGSFSDEQLQLASDLSEPLEKELLYSAAEHGYQFHYDPAWYVTAEQSDLLSLRCLQAGDLTAHCNLSTLPARSEGRHTTLEQFERDVRESLGDNLESVSAATQWKTAQGHDCLGIIADGTFKKVPVQWRYYLISADGLPRVSLAVTLEQSQIDRFADADRQLVDSLQLIPKAASATAAKARKQSAR